MEPKNRFPLRWLLPAAALLACPLPALADSPRFEMTPFVGTRVGGGFDLTDTTSGIDESVDLGTGASFGLDLGVYRDSQSFYELLYSTQTSAVESDSAAVDGVDLRIDYLQFGGTLFFPQENNHFVPYMSLTVGATLLKPDGDFDSETKLSGGLAGGFRFPLNDSVAVNLGVRGYLTLLESDTELFCVSDSTQAGCLVRSSGSTFFQAEGSLGLSVRF